MIRRIAIYCITFYQKCLSPSAGSCCRFYPSCSEYTKEAINTHGMVRALFMGTKRIMKCHPFHPGGYDPVEL